jgi:hypothetical protein
MDGGSGGRARPWDDPGPAPARGPRSSPIWEDDRHGNRDDEDGGAESNQLLGPLSHSLGVEAARQKLGRAIDPALQARSDELADLCNEGLLSEADRSEFKSDVEGIGLINLLKAKACQVLATKLAS